VNPSYPEVAQRAERRCEYCRAPETVFNFRFEVEHILPRVDRGPDELPNLALSCGACNSYKRDFTSALDPESGEVVPLFHPRREIWAEHFFFDDESLELRGLTPQGRATVVRLKMNDAFQIEARARWVQSELYP
jgi:hypothetical protein